jgi:hypothetical protein
MAKQPRIVPTKRESVKMYNDMVTTLRKQGRSPGPISEGTLRRFGLTTKKK